MQGLCLTLIEAPRVSVGGHLRQLRKKNLLRKKIWPDLLAPGLRIVERQNRHTRLHHRYMDGALVHTL
jgi:hypothetical protein